MGVPGLLPRLINTGRVACWASREAEIAFRDAETLERLQARRLGRLLWHAWENVPHYREWMRAAAAEPGDIRRAGDLGLLPPVPKLELTLHPERFVAPGHHAGDGLTLVSSGTSGYRRALRQDTRAVLEALAAGRRQRLALAEFTGRESGYREAVLNRHGSAGAQIRAFIESRIVNPPGADLRRRLFPPDQPFEILREGINEFKPDVVRGIGSHVGALFRWLRDCGKPFHRPRAITFGADSMPPADRRLIEEDLGIPVVSTYQAVEALRIGFECPVRRGLHLSIDQVAVRVVDEAGRDVPPGEPGELVLTNLTNYATPVINYRLGDIVTMGGGICPCGRTLPLLLSIDGRADDLVVRPDGSRFHAFTLLPRLQAVAGVARVQIEQTAVDDFLLRVVRSAGEAPRHADLEEQMKKVLGRQIRVRVEEVDAIPPAASGKVKSLISRVPNEIVDANPP